MNYRVSTKPNGDKRWWGEWDKIPLDHTDVRPATPEEAAVMHRIVHAKGQPSLALGKMIQRMLQNGQGALL